MKKQTIILLWTFLLVTISLAILFVFMGIKILRESGAITWVANKIELVTNNFGDLKNRLIVDESEISYCAQLYFCEKIFPEEVKTALSEIGDIRSEINIDSATTYYSRTFKTQGSCDSAILVYKTFNLENVVRMIEYRDVIYTPEKFEELYKIKD